ncbi:arginine--tRNA ligase [Gammaproteobacteria bacterium]|nr:arginine--tRNA ligase [Gammaproteobacteria bacterium]MDA8798321.1 arginine--tRNA ligase [Gammaproteobacteria bacterium]MDC0918459.1 arginine--tRNA ligase [Gammaproteobacteria bacterium]
MYNQISSSLNDFIENELSLHLDQRKALSSKHKLTLTDSLQKGHWTTNLCLIASNLTKKNPRDIASALMPKLESQAEIEKVELAGPGFVNIFLTRQAFLSQLDDAHKHPNSFVDSSHALKKKIQIEFVSANPTGPLHVGHGRGAAYGDAIGRILQRLGHEVSREYYVNDAGRQIDILACSIFLRKFECFEDNNFPGSAYKGSYILEIAQGTKIDLTLSTAEKATLIDNLPSDDEEKIDVLIERIKINYSNSWLLIREHGLDYVIKSIKEDLTEFKVIFDNWFFESSLGELADKKSEISMALDRVKKEHAYEKNGAVWLESTKFGDDKDRVIIREDGRGTYLSADLAYHRNKLDRGFDTIINVWGSDHHGYIKRIEATIEAMGYSKKQMQVQLVQFANLFENGSKVKMSTRSGNFYTLKQLIDDIGPDASRFYYLSKQADQHLDFDIGIARSNSKDNLYYYVQYAHARICSVEKKYLESGGSLPKKFNGDDFGGCDELLQMALSAQFVIKSAGENLQPHLIVYYLRDISQSFHQFYNSVNILNAKDSEQNNIIRSLIIVKSVIASSLELLGIEPLESM